MTIEPDRTLKLNTLTDMGTVDDLSKLNAKLVALFAERKQNRVYREDMVTRVDLPESANREDSFHQGPTQYSLR